MKVGLERWLAAAPLHRRVMELLDEQALACYLVGGTVRDLLLDRVSKDIDLAVEHDALRLGRWLADRLGGAFVPLDVERDVARVVLGQGSEQQHVDLAGFRGADLVADLRARDYTINAMAIVLSGDARGTLIDPTAGREDLEAGWMRLAYGDALRDDPLRLLRGLRIGVMLGFTLDDAAREAIGRAVPLLADVSAERLRDELLSILSLAGAASALRQAVALGALDEMLPAVRWNPEGEALLEALSAFRFGTGALWEELGPYAESIRRDAMATIVADRSRWPIIMLAGLLQTAGEEGNLVADDASERLALSRRESVLLSRSLMSCAGSVLNDPHSHLDDLALHRLLRHVGWAGAAAALLTAARALSARDDGDWRIERARAVLEAWYRRHGRVVAPPQLLTGGELMAALRLPAGPCIGKLLRAVQEAQVVGSVATREEALAYCAQMLEARSGSAGASSEGESSSCRDETGFA